MSVYVDQIQRWPTAIRCFKSGSCHLFADTAEELHAFAKRLGLKREWFQEHRLLPHYDLTLAMRAKAVAIGAVEVSMRAWLKERREAAVCITPNGRTDGHGTYVQSVDGVLVCEFCKKPITTSDETRNGRGR